MADERELRECPFCGSDDVEADFGFTGKDEVPFFFVVCNGCQAMGPEVENKGDAPAAWNRRADPPQPEDKESPHE